MPWRHRFWPLIEDKWNRSFWIGATHAVFTCYKTCAKYDYWCLLRTNEYRSRFSLNLELSPTLRRRSVFIMRRLRPGVSGEKWDFSSAELATLHGFWGSETDDNSPCVIHNNNNIDINTPVSGKRVGVSMLICYTVLDGRDDLFTSNRSGVESQHLHMDRWIIIEPISRTWRVQGCYRLLSVPADFYATIEISLFWKNHYFFFFLLLPYFKILRKNRIVFEQY